MNAKIQKLINKYDNDKHRNAESASSSDSLPQIFTGVAIFINGYTGVYRQQCVFYL